MKTISHYLLRSLAVAAALACAGTLQAAPSYVFDPSDPTSDIPGLTGFSTTGAMMDGMGVSVLFVDGATESRSWADTGPVSGGVFGTGWALTVSGDTFGASWSFTNATGVPIQSFSLTGNTGLTIFDVDMYSVLALCDSYVASGIDEECSPGSARGARMTFGNPDLSPTVTYNDIVGLGGLPPIGDLFHVVTADFGPNGVGGDFLFRQDTDNDSRFTIPEPGTMVLLGLALAGLGLAQRRQR